MVLQSTQGAVTVLSVEGPLDGRAAELLADRVAGLPRGGRPQLVIELSATPLADSRGCEALLDARDAVIDLGGAAHLAGPNALCRDIFDATGLSDQFEVYGSLAEAVATFAR